MVRIKANTFPEALHEARDDSAETVRLLDKGLQLNRSVMMYIDSVSPTARFTDAEITLVDEARATVQWLCENMSLKTPTQVGDWLEKPQFDLGDRSIMETMFIDKTANMDTLHSMHRMVMELSVGQFKSSP